MKRYIAMMILGLIGITVSGGGANAQPAQQQASDWPDWAYGYLVPLAPGDTVALPCPVTTTNPRDCRRPTEDEPDDGIERTLPDTTATSTRNEAGYGYGPADWYPGDHPSMPDIVAHGNESA